MLYILGNVARRIANDSTCEHSLRSFIFIARFLFGRLSIYTFSFLVRLQRDPFYSEWLIPKCNRFHEFKGWELPVLHGRQPSGAEASLETLSASTKDETSHVDEFFDSTNGEEEFSEPIGCDQGTLVETSSSS